MRKAGGPTVVIAFMSFRMQTPSSPLKSHEVVSIKYWCQNAAVGLDRSPTASSILM